MSGPRLRWSQRWRPWNTGSRSSSSRKPSSASAAWRKSATRCAAPAGRPRSSSTAPGVLAAGWADRALPHLAAAGVSWQVWSGLTANPKDTEVAAGFEQYRESGWDVLVAIGGGSPIDAAKAVAVLSGNGGRILDYEGIDTIAKPIPPMVMVPSTGGSGADGSQSCVITDTGRRLKATIAGRALVPDISVTDPSLLTTMPPELSAHTALDALSHGIEAYVSKAASFLSDGHALAAIRGVLDHLLPSIDDPADLRA